MKLFLCFIFHSILFLGCSQNTAPRVFDSLTCAENLDSLRTKMSAVEGLPNQYQLAFYTAMHYYPELDSSVIRFKESHIKTTLNARPTVGSLIFRKRDKRKYVVRINTKERDSLILLEDVPFNAQIGLFGHELAHFSDYQSRSFRKVVKRLFSYATTQGKTDFEKEIDSITITKGLGWQLYAWSYFVLYDSKGSEAYKAFKSSVYLKPEEISTQIQEANTEN